MTLHKIPAKAPSDHWAQTDVVQNHLYRMAGTGCACGHTCGWHLRFPHGAACRKQSRSRKSLVNKVPKFFISVSIIFVASEACTSLCWQLEKPSITHSWVKKLHKLKTMQINAFTVYRGYTYNLLHWSRGGDSLWNGDGLKTGQFQMWQVKALWVIFRRNMIIHKRQKVHFH